MTTKKKLKAKIKRQQRDINQHCATLDVVEIMDELKEQLLDEKHSHIDTLINYNVLMGAIIDGYQARDAAVVQLEIICDDAAAEWPIEVDGCLAVH